MNLQTMHTPRITKLLGFAVIALLWAGCVPSIKQKTENTTTPTDYKAAGDTVNAAKIQWRDFFTDPNLQVLIDTALRNNQELNIMIQEIQVAQAEVRARKGAYLPFVNIGAQAGVEKTPRYTRNGAVDANTEIDTGKEFPDPLPDYMIGANVSWEVDIWKKLRNAKKSAVYRFLSTQEGRNFMVTHLIAEIASSYYELMALDNQLEILKQNIQIQQNALAIVRMEKQAARVTELAVRRFEAEVLKNQGRQYYIRQAIVETTNRINFLTGRFPQDIPRNSMAFIDLPLDSIHSGAPSQLLANRPDVKQAELVLLANKLDVKVARANFYPTLNINGVVGLEAFSPSYLFGKSGSAMYYLGAGFFGPLVNRNAIKAAYYTANARQTQAVYDYERTILNAYIEVANQVSNIKNLNMSYERKTKQVAALTESIDISVRLFRNARADYMEVLLVQRDALESRFDLVETKMQQMHARINIYQALGGGWR